MKQDSIRHPLLIPTSVGNGTIDQLSVYGLCMVFGTHPCSKVIFKLIPPVLHVLVVKVT